MKITFQEYPMKKFFIQALVLGCFLAAEVQGEPVKSIRLVLPPQPGPIVENIGRVFVRQIESRSDAKVVLQAQRR